MTNPYILIINNGGELFRFLNGVTIPNGFRKALKDKFNSSYYDENGNLKPNYWAVERYDHHVSFLKLRMLEKFKTNSMG